MAMEKVQENNVKKFDLKTAFCFFILISFCL